MILRQARAQADKRTEESDRIDREWDEAERELPLPTFPSLNSDKTLSLGRD